MWPAGIAETYLKGHVNAGNYWFPGDNPRPPVIVSSTLIVFLHPYIVVYCHLYKGPYIVVYCHLYKGPYIVVYCHLYKGPYIVVYCHLYKGPYIVVYCHLYKGPYIVVYCLKVLCSLAVTRLINGKKWKIGSPRGDWHISLIGWDRQTDRLCVRVHTCKPASHYAELCVCETVC